jgi:hypothetical protein
MTDLLCSPTPRRLPLPRWPSGRTPSRVRLLALGVALPVAAIAMLLPVPHPTPPSTAVSTPVPVPQIACHDLLRQVRPASAVGGLLAADALICR